MNMEEAEYGDRGVGPRNESAMLYRAMDRLSNAAVVQPYPESLAVVHVLEPEMAHALLQELGKLRPLIKCVQDLLEAPEFEGEVSIYTSRLIVHARALVGWAD